MSRPLKAGLKIGGGLAAGSALVAEFGLPGAAAVVIVMLALIGAVCWVIADGSRSARLAMLITAARGQAGRGAVAGEAGQIPARTRPTKQHAAGQRAIP